MNDKLIIKGLQGLEGTYEFDLPELLTIGAPGQLTNREGHRLKTISGVRVGELQDSLAAGDNDVFVALAAIILSRHGKRFDEDVLWDAPMLSGITFELADREDDAGPPESQTATANGGSGETVTPSTSGGESSSRSSGKPGNDQRGTGDHA